MAVNLQEKVVELEERIDRTEKAIDAISARLADVQLHPALSVPPLPGFEIEEKKEN